MGTMIERCLRVASCVALVGLTAPAGWAQSMAGRADATPMQTYAVLPTGDHAADSTLQKLIAMALGANPELQALDGERRAARHRAASAGALDDPMLEAGVLNLPVDSLRFNREDMTMKMIGVSQRLPYPGKRALREQIAAKEAGTVDLNYREAANRMVRDGGRAILDAQQHVLASMPPGPPMRCDFPRPGD